jgi:hypothetical protein
MTKPMGIMAIGPLKIKRQKHEKDNSPEAVK